MVSSTTDVHYDPYNIEINVHLQATRLSPASTVRGFESLSAHIPS